MKKTLGIILLVALTLVTFGCKKIDDLGNTKDVPKWNSMESLGGNSEKLLDIRAEKHAINWWVITDMNGVVFDDYEIILGEGNQFNKEDDYVEIGKTETIPQGKAIRLKFDVEKNTDLILWIAQDDRIPAKKDSNGNEFPAGAKDYRGKIKISTSQGYSIKDQGYREEVSSVGVVKVFCNETAAGKTKADCKNGKWSGDYKITEIWPLSNKNGPQWEATEDLKFILETPIEEGESLKIIYPAGNSIFAIKQPSRFAENLPEDSKEAKAKEKQVDWYWCAAFYPRENDVLTGENKITDTSDSNLNVTYYGPVVKHAENKAYSYDCGAYFKLSNETLYKSALGTTYIIDDEDIVYGASEK